MANNEYVNKVDFGNDTIIDISNTTAEAGDVLQGQTFYTRSGAPATGTLGDATTSTHGLMSAADKIKLDGISVMTGATSLTAGTSGLVPAPTISDPNNYLRGDGTWNQPVVILTYGVSTYQDFIDVFNAGAIVYCKAPAEVADPTDTLCVRYAALSYANLTLSHPIIEFLYYRARAHSLSTLGDEVWIYTLNENSEWSYKHTSVGIREVVISGNGISTSWSNQVLTLTTSPFTGATSSAAGTGGMVPAPAITDVGKFLCSDGTWAAVSGGSGSSNGGNGILGITLASTTLAADANGVVNIPAMGGCTSSTAGSIGAVPAPAAGDENKFLSGDGTWKSGGLPMVVLSYGNSTWSDFINAYNNNVIVYCRASNANDPSTGNQTRMAFLAYVNSDTAPTEVEFQYYRSVSSHSATTLNDEVFVYKLNKTSGWSVTKRYASLRQIIAGTGMEVSYNNNQVTVSSVIPTPPATNGTYTLQVTVTDGTPAYSWI